MKLQKLRWNFNPLSLYRERQVRNKYGYVSRYISIHSPYTGRDDAILRQFGVDVKFQSTLPIQGETFCFLLPSSETVISIHSPYTGRDGTSAYTAICLSVISIHSPYTGRDCSCCMCVRLCGHFNPLSLYRERPPPILLF